MNSVKIMSKACEMFILDLAMRSHQTKKVQDCDSAQEDVITVSTVRTITQTKYLLTVYICIVFIGRRCNACIMYIRDS